MSSTRTAYVLAACYPMRGTRTAYRVDARCPASPCAYPTSQTRIRANDARIRQLPSYVCSYGFSITRLAPPRPAIPPILEVVCRPDAAVYGGNAAVYGGNATVYGGNAVGFGGNAAMHGDNTVVYGGNADKN
eukprot:1689488-Rhodomonas_salina.1